MSAAAWTDEQMIEVANRLLGIAQAVWALGRSAEMADTIGLAAEMLAARSEDRRAATEAGLDRLKRAATKAPQDAG